MSVQMILLPLFVQVILTFSVGVMMAFRRRRAFASRQTRWQEIALREPNWPKDAAQAANSYANQFEMPVLFYVLTILALVTKQADIVFVVMAWIFVLSRIVQAAEHLTTNVVPRRGAYFAIGVVVLMIMWAIYIVRILTLSWV